MFAVGAADAAGHHRSIAPDPVHRAL